MMPRPHARPVAADPAPAPRFTVVIPTLRPDTLGAAIVSIRRQSFTDWELVVVGQGDPAPLRRAVDVAARDDQRVRYVHLSRRGLSLARNAGVARSRGEIVALTDDDCEADQRWLEVLDRCFADHPDVGLVGGSLVAPAPGRRGPASCPAFDASELLYRPLATRRTAPPGWGLVGGNFAVRRAVLDTVGEFDEHLGAGSAFAAAEETDLMLRLELLGIPMLTTPRSVVHHTSGHRYGWRAVYRHKRAYARGNGALAAKLALSGDPRGDAWVRSQVRAATVDHLRELQPQRMPLSLLRSWHFVRAYRLCRRRFEVSEPGDQPRAVLRPRDVAATAADGTP